MQRSSLLAGKRASITDGEDPNKWRELRISEDVVTIEGDDLPSVLQVTIQAR